MLKLIVALLLVASPRPANQSVAVKNPAVPREASTPGRTYRGTVETTLFPLADAGQALSESHRARATLAREGTEVTLRFVVDDTPVPCTFRLRDEGARLVFVALQFCSGPGVVQRVERGEARVEGRRIMIRFESTVTLGAAGEVAESARKVDTFNGEQE